jgi:hypothetical protein
MGRPIAYGIGALLGLACIASPAFGCEKLPEPVTVIKTYDKNNDGHISFEVAGIASGWLGRNSLQQADSNKDGMLSLEEITVSQAAYQHFCQKLMSGQ